MSTPTEPPARTRYVEHNTFVSTHTPALRLELAPAFRYVGHVEFDLSGTAHVERHIFVDATGARVHRMFIFQFESFLPGNLKTYNFAMTDPIMLGSTPFTHHNYFFSNAAELTALPHAETAHTLQLLQSHGYVIEDEQMTSRFARVVGADRRNELILFYHENIRDTGYTLSQIATANEEILPAYAHLALALTQRSLESFDLQSYTDTPTW